MLLQEPISTLHYWPPLGESVIDRLLTPVYGGLTRTAITEAEARYGPYAVGFTLGLFAFVLYLGRKVL
jgi:hypothetical protein